MNFEEFKEKFDAFLEEVTTEELVSDFERLGCPIYQRDDCLYFGSEDVIDEEVGSVVEYSDNAVYDKIQMSECSFQVQLHKPVYFKGSRELTTADSYFDNDVDLSLAA